MFLAILSIIVLQALIVIFSCELSCAGQDGAAAVLLFGGTIVLAFLAVFTFINISKIVSSEENSKEHVPLTK